MKVYEAWKKSLELLNGEREEALFWGEYYDKETQNYKKILGEKSFVLKGTEAELAEQFNMEPPVFAGFIDGANTSLKEQVDLEALEDTTELDMEFEPEKLYYNMLNARAKWLYNLPEWEDVLSKEKRHEILEKWKDENIAKSVKVGRNDPCPCGSGKKYKFCCGK